MFSSNSIAFNSLWEIRVGLCISCSTCAEYFSLQLIAFNKFKSTAEAVETYAALQDGKVSKSLQKLLKKKVTEDDKLAVADPKLGNLLKVLSFTLVIVACSSESSSHVRPNSL